jgi:gliding motility-associated-like protein
LEQGYPDLRRFALRFILLLLPLCSAGSAALANHVSGADLFYEHLSGNTYRITLVVYGNCDPNQTTSGPFSTLINAQPEITIFVNGSHYRDITLALQGQPTDVTPVCSSQKNNTACNNPNGTLPGIMRFIYSVNVTLGGFSTDWRFHFDGKLGPAGVADAGRYNGISNLVAAGTNVMALDAELNNSAGPNSSPQFTTIPTPFYCINVAQQYNLGAFDADGDSLSFALVPGLLGAGSNGGVTGTVTYAAGYSAINPLSVAVGTFSFSSATGQMNFTPNNTQIALVVQRVSEYRNGVLVGTATREMNFVVLANCNTTPASSRIDTAKGQTAIFGGEAAGPNDFILCYGIDSAYFRIIALNPAADTISYVSLAGLPAGVSAEVDTSVKTQPVITIIWDNKSATPGNYTFYVTYKDNGCPLTSTQTMAYTIHVVRPNEMASFVAAPTQCIHQALVDFRFSNGLLPRTIVLSQGGNVVRTYRDSTGNVRDSLPAGTYDVLISSAALDCRTTATLIIPDSGLYPSKPGVAPAFYCLHDQPMSLSAVADSGAILHWYNASGAFLGFTPTPSTDSVGIFFWLVEQQFKSCVSLRDTAQVYVTKRPVASFAGPKSICLNDSAAFSFTGQVGVGPILDYRWNFGGAGYMQGDSAGPWRVHWYDTGFKLITLQVDENKCSSFPFRDTIYIKQVPYAGFDVADVCQFDTVRIRYNTQPPRGLQYAWSFDGAEGVDSTGPGPYVLRWPQEGLKYLSLTVDLDGCRDTRHRSLTVFPKPEAAIDYEWRKLCQGDRITMAGTGGGSYLWSSSDPNVLSSDRPVFSALILRPQTIRVIVSNQWNCSDTASQTISTVEACCKFSYPNAFTPNGDQRNDIFRIITYGNQVQFELSIYDRWGERVFHGDNALIGWDGTFKGRACDVGAYFYHMYAECFTGHKEEYKGTVLLLR